MMQFIFTNLVLLSAGVLLYLSVRALPRMEAEDPRGRKERWLEKLLASEIPHRLDAAFNSFGGKLLRKLKVWLLRFDNLITELLKRISSHQNAAGKKIDFGEITGEKKDSESGTES